MPNLNGDKHVLVVEQERDICDLISMAYSSLYEVRCAFSAAEARHIIGARRPDLALIDSMLPDEDGLSLARHAASCDVGVLLMTTDPLLAAKCEASRVPVLRKPFRLAELLSRTEAALAGSSAAQATAAALMRETAERLAKLEATYPQTLRITQPRKKT